MPTEYNPLHVSPANYPSVYKLFNSSRLLHQLHESHKCNTVQWCSGAAQWFGLCDYVGLLRPGNFLPNLSGKIPCQRLWRELGRLIGNIPHQGQARHGCLLMSLGWRQALVTSVFRSGVEQFRNWKLCSQGQTVLDRLRYSCTGHVLTNTATSTNLTKTNKGHLQIEGHSY